MKSPGGGLKIGERVGSAVEFNNPNAASSTNPEIGDFYHFCRRFQPGKIVQMHF